MEEFRHTPLEVLVKRNYKVLENDCWEWTSSISSQTGYGKLVYGGKDISAHRASYIVFKGEIPKGLHVCHTCDNRKCVNPDHLWIGTQKDNMQDMIAKGRKAIIIGKKLTKEHMIKLHQGRIDSGWSREGSKHHMAKLNEEKIKEIKIMLANGHTNNEIAEIYNVDKSNISLIRNGKRWMHVNI